MNSKICKNCEQSALTIDPDSKSIVCKSCGFVYNSQVFENQTFDRNGNPLGSMHNNLDFGYRERKLHRARTIISNLTSSLNLSSAHSNQVSILVSKATDSNLGSGLWFPVLVAACAIIVMRKHSAALSLAEAARAIGHDPRELGRMIGRVSRHLDLGQLPELDAVRVLEQTVHDLAPFAILDEEKVGEILGQGRFILHCAIRWFLTTGRHPLPVVAAVLGFVSEVNGLEIGVEEIARSIHAGVLTSRRRLKELMEVLVEVGKKMLPWGDDVTVKNIVCNAPVLIRLMELKCKGKVNCGGDGDDCVGEIKLDDMLKPYLDYVGVAPEESRYFGLGGGDDGDSRLNWDGIEGLKLLAEDIRVSDAYDSVLDRHRLDEEIDGGKRRRKGLDIEDWIESWKGRWESDKGLNFEQVLQRNEGYEALPPSFIKGMDLRRMRRMKIEAAKNRIHRIMKRKTGVFEGATCIGEDVKLLEHSSSLSRKRRKRNGVIDGLDWEDCIIELLLLHQVKEEEIEQGYYNRLLDLHVFSSS